MSILVLSNLFGRQLTDSYHNCERIHTGPNGWEIETVFSKRKHNRERSLLDWAPAQEADFLASWQRAVSIRNFLVFLIRNPIMEFFFKKLSIRRFLIEHSVNSIGFFNKKKLSWHFSLNFEIRKCQLSNNQTTADQANVSEINIHCYSMNIIHQLTLQRLILDERGKLGD